MERQKKDFSLILCRLYTIIHNLLKICTCQPELQADRLNSNDKDFRLMLLVMHSVFFCCFDAQRCLIRDRTHTAVIEAVQAMLHKRPKRKSLFQRKNILHSERRVNVYLREYEAVQFDFNGGEDLQSLVFEKGNRSIDEGR